jgi:membrane protein
VGLSTEVAIAWQILEWAIALFLLIMVFALTYYWAPDVAQAKWLWITPGSILGILTWIAASLGFRLYLHYFDSYSKTYGSMGAVIVLLLWFYISGFALLCSREPQDKGGRSVCQGEGREGSGIGQTRMPSYLCANCLVHA